MSGTIRMFLAIAVFIAAGYGLAFLWTGELPPYAVEVAGTMALLLILAIIVTVITKPAGEKH